MPQSLVNQMLHCVFSTKDRGKIITTELAERMFPYFGGIARENKIKLLAVGGMPDHLHFADFNAFDNLNCQSNSIIKGKFFKMDS